MSRGLIILMVAAVTLSLFVTPSMLSAEAPGLEVIDNFNSDGEGWRIYDYNGGQGAFYYATWESSGGLGDSGYIWGDDSRWSIDTPETPDSILSFIIYRSWVGGGALDLRNAMLSVHLRGFNLDLKGANVLFWVFNSGTPGTRWHYTAQPLEVSEGAWGQQQSIVLKNDENLWHRSWYRTSPASLDDILSAVDSYGFSFVGFSQEVTGTFAMDKLEIRNLPGDVNADGFVGGDDLTIILEYWGQSVTGREQGDLNGDFFVGGDDYSEVLTHWGEGIPSATVFARIPEPATLTLLLLSGLALLSCKRPI